MKHKLAFLLVLLVAGVARADHVTAYDFTGHTTDCVDNGIPCVTFAVTGSYELNKQGQPVGPWSFQDYDGGVSGNGTTQVCGYGGCSYGTSSGYFQDWDPDRNIVDNWLQIPLGNGSSGGSGFDYACFIGECGDQRAYSGYFTFTGVTTIDHDYKHDLDPDKKLVPIPEPSSLLLTGIGLLGIAALCSLRRLSPLAIRRG